MQLTVKRQQQRLTHGAVETPCSDCASVGQVLANSGDVWCFCHHSKEDWHSSLVAVPTTTAQASVLCLCHNGLAPLLVDA